MKLLRLLRFPNLLVVALTQGLIYYRIVLPAYATEGLSPALNAGECWLLVIVTMVVTAGGYVINDVLDARSDSINHPGKNQVYELGEDRVRWIYLGLILAGYTMSLLLAIRLGELSLLWLYPLTVSLLALYSRYIKPVPLAGNVLVALYCAGVPTIIALAERSQLGQLMNLNPAAATHAWQVILVYGLFAFVATLLRELVKDVEDINGDRVIGRRTIPVLWGIGASRTIGLLLSLLILLAVSLPVLLGWPPFKAPLILGLMVVLALSTFYFGFRLLRSSEPRDFGRISSELKLFLLAGLCLLIFI